MSSETRTYRMTRRAALQDETRLRITESAVELHGSVGPARTSVSAVAERAGVRRSTVYRHFPDEAALFAACSEHWNAANPPPDISRWAQIDDPAHRLRVGLGELYAYYARTEPMIANVVRDAPVMPVVQARFAGFLAFLDDARDLVVAGRGARGRPARRVRAAVGHALSFTTWRSLIRDQSLDDAEAVELMCRLVEVAQAGGSRVKRATGLEP